MSLDLGLRVAVDVGEAGGLDTGSALAVARYAVETVVAGWLVVAVPLLGRARYRSLRASSVDRAAFYRRAMARQWILAAGVVGVLWLLGEPLGALGLRARGAVGPALTSVGLPVVVAAAATTLALRGQAARRPDRPLVARLLRPVEALLPVTRTERWLFAGVAVTAGITEEVLYRGVLGSWAVTTAPGAGSAGVVAVSALAFGVAHAYQGRLGVVLTGAAGYVLATMYLTTGSLLAPMIAHVIVDLRVLLLVPSRGPGGPALTSGFASSGDDDGGAAQPAASTPTGSLSSP